MTILGFILLAALIAWFLAGLTKNASDNIDSEIERLLENDTELYDGSDDDSENL